MDVLFSRFITVMLVIVASAKKPLPKPRAVILVTYLPVLFYAGSVEEILW